MSEDTFLNIIMTIVAISTLMLVIFGPYRIKRVKKKEKHLKWLYDNILTKLLNLSRPSYQEFFMWVERTEKENTDEYKWTFQHFRDKHTNISMNYDLVEKHAKKLNDELLKDIKEYIENEIRKDIGDNHIPIFSNVIWEVIEESVKGKIKNLDTLKITKEKYGVRVWVSSTGGPFIRSEQCNKNKAEGFLSKLIADKRFRKKILDIKKEDNDINDAFDKFKENLKELINKIISSGVDELKGGCDRCSYLVKWFGDC